VKARICTPHICLLSIALFPFLAFFSQLSVRETGAPGVWTEPINLSNTQSYSTSPLVASDSVGIVHVVWGESSQEDDSTSPDTVYYKRLIDGTWSDSYDILAVSRGDSAVPHALTVDQHNRLALLWSQNNQLNISMADAADARSAQAWATVPLESGASIHGADLALDQSGKYHVAYVRNAEEIVTLYADDTGDNWSVPVVVTSNTQAEFAFSLVSTAVDATGRVFVSWTRHAEETNWAPAGVWLSRSIDEGQTWPVVEEVAPGQGYGASELFVDADDKLHLVWIGNLAAGGRYHRWSSDGGDNWSDSATISLASGYAGPPTMLQDNDARIHLVSAGIGLGRQESIWYSSLEERGWSSALAISGDLPDSQGPSAAISLGHVIHAVWIEYDSADIWYSSYDTGAPATPARATENVVAAPTQKAESVAELQSVDTPSIPRAISEPITALTTDSALTSGVPGAWEAGDAQHTTISGSAILIISAFPALVVVGGVVLFQLKRRRQS